MRKVNLDEKFRLLTDTWNPKIVAELDDSYVKVARLKGEYEWHTHAAEDEMFLVRNGHLTIRMRGGEVRLGPGELFVVPRGTEHMPVAEHDVDVVVIERKTTVREGGPRDPSLRDEWI